MSAQSLVPVSECHLKICTQRLTFETLPKFDQSDQSLDGKTNDKKKTQEHKMFEASLGHVWDNIWGILSTMDNNPRCYMHL